MERDMLAAIAEEIGEVETMAELNALWCYGQSANNEYGDAECVPHFRAAAKRLRGKAEMFKETCDPTELALNDWALPPKQVKRTASSRKYRLLKKEIEWSTKPQVHAIMEILAAHAEVGDVLDEEQIVGMMVANEAVLRTRQGGKRIWDYYKGDHAEGLVAHGNVERI